MDYLPVVFSVVLVVLAIVLTVVGVQMIIVLTELRKTLRKVNHTLDTVDMSVNAVVQPLQNLGGMASGLSTGMRVFEAFTGWLQRNQNGR